MLTQLKLKPVYFTVIFLLFIFGLVFSVVFPKSLSFQYLNQFHSQWLDSFFIRYTILGDGLTSVLGVIFLLLLRRFKESLVLLLAFLSSGLIACLLKNLFSLPRPKLYFQELHLTYNSFIDGVTLVNNSSFPSGHTTSAFAMATIVVLLSYKKLFSLFAITAALLVAYSRVYLGQHFLQDVTVGGLIGVACAMVSYYFIFQKQVKLFKGFKKNKYSVKEEMSPQWN